MGFELRRQDGGVLAVYDPATGETMHPVLGPWAEANRLYLAASRLEARLLTPPGSLPPGPPDVTVFDVGLGGAANALAAVALHQQLLRQSRPVRPLRVVSFEHDPGAVPFVLANAAALGYPRGHEPLLEALQARGEAHGSGGLSWYLRLGDFPALVEEEPTRAEVVFFDPFSPRTNPAMWRLDTMERLFRARRPGVPLHLVTYSSAFGARAAMLLAGFFVGEGPRLSPRRRTTVACTDFAGLEAPLELGWLRRWRQDREPWPPGTAPQAHRALREALLAHPQWAHFEPEPDPGAAAERVHARGRRGPRQGGERPGQGGRQRAGGGKTPTGRRRPR